MSVTSEDIKIALLSNYRYKKQSIAADEVGFMLGNTDVSVYQDGFLTEIEIKTSKSDMWQGEKAKKEKHDFYQNPTPDVTKKYHIPHYFFMCVPTFLLDEAKKWVLTTNEKYGILEFRGSKTGGIWIPRPEDLIYVAKRAKLIHQEPCPKSLERIARRLSSANITLKSRLKSLSRDYNEAYKELRELKNGKH